MVPDEVAAEAEVVEEVAAVGSKETSNSNRVDSRLLADYAGQEYMLSFPSLMGQLIRLNFLSWSNSQTRSNSQTSSYFRP